MKNSTKTYFFSLALMSIFVLSGTLATGQTTYLEDFQNGMPADYILLNEDGLTPATFTPAATDAWAITTNPADQTDSVAASTSWYNPPGTADDWMITTKLEILSNSMLRWNAVVFEAAYPDGYEVLISTGQPTIADFNQNQALFTITAEDPAWQTRTVDIAAAGYTNDSVFIAFRNNSTDMNLLFIDDIEIYNPFSVNLGVVGFDVPIKGTCSDSTEVWMDITNAGLDTITGFDVSFTVNGSTPVVETIAGSINPGQTINYTFNSKAFLNQSGMNNIEGRVIATNDGDPANDTMFTAITYNDNLLTLDVNEDFESGSTADLMIWNAVDATAEVSNTAGNSSSYGILMEGSTFDTWTNAASENEVWTMNENHSGYASVCVDPGAASNLKMRFDLQQVPTPFGQSYLYNNFRVMINGVQQGNTYHPDTSQGATPEFNLVEFDLNPFLGGPIDILLETRNKYDDAGVDAGTGGQVTVGDKVLIDNFSISEPKAPTAGFTFTTNDLEASFTDASTDFPDTWSWNFGDGNSSTMKDPTHTYADAGTYNVCLTVANAQGNDNSCQDVTVTAPVVGAVADISEEEIRVYPNPTRNLVNLEMNRQNRDAITVELYDALGALQYSTIWTSNNADKLAIDLSAYPNGIYLLKVSGEDLSYNKQIHVNK